MASIFMSALQAIASPAGIMAASTALSAQSAYQQGQYASAQAKAQSKISLHNAEIARVNAKAIEQKSIFDQLRALRRGEKRLGTLRAGLGASGAMVSEGAPASLIAEQGFENALDVALIGHEGVVAASRQRSAANLYAHEAENYRLAASSAKRAGAIGVGTSLLQGFGNMFAAGMFDFGGDIAGGGSSTVNISGSSFTNPQAVFGAPAGT
jgi:hypothetical protein